MLSPEANEHAASTAYELAESRYWLGCALTAAGHTAEALGVYQALLADYGPDSPPMPGYAEMKPVYWATVAALDRLLADPAAFRSLCNAQRARWPDRSPNGRCSWYPVPAQPLCGCGGGTGCEVTAQMLAQWQWCDPYQDGAHHVEHGPELVAELVAADGRDLWFINTGAPSLRTGVEGDFGLQARCLPSPLRPLATGGLLLWCDGANFVRLDWGGLGPGEISFLGWAGGERRFWGRARSSCGQPYLRLARSGDKVQALYSEDGRQWLLIGETTLVVGGPWTIGLLALGIVDRILYPGAPAGGAAIRFDSIQLWRG